jgi:hypothetical protein
MPIVAHPGRNGRPEAVRRLKRLLRILVSAAALAACGGKEAALDATRDTAPTWAPETSGREQPPMAPRLVLQMRTGGGFVPPEHAFTTVPDFTLYADGRLVQPGVRTAVYPGPALPSLFIGSVSAQDVDAAVSDAKQAGLTENPNAGRPMVTDLATTTFVLVTGGRTYRIEAYALGVDNVRGLTPAQRDSRRRLEDLRRRLEALAVATPLAPYRAESVSVLVRPYRESGFNAPQDAGPDEAEWPLGALTTGGKELLDGRCIGFSGPEADKVLAAADDAKVNTQWRSGGMTWALSFRPELPGSEPCSER